MSGELMESEEFKAAKVILEVQAGIIPGEPMEEYTRRWAMSREEIEAEDKTAYIDTVGAAMNYALCLENPAQVNWVRFEWLWT